MCNMFLEKIKKINPNKETTDLIIFVGALNVQFGGDLLKMYYPELIFMRGVGHTVSLF